ncbi:MAG: cytochrome c oxidase subunit 3 [Gemmatimonadota bacterium]|jgi:cytochrome c oxidase subunit 3|nr:cytochrome c oxidase subunit 3 [Chloroflexota bacterium]MDH5196707.1 cytochrome c oxidase subunit 3 [Gemmatimonadota bacterium]
MASDTHALATVEHSPVGSLAHDTRGGISNPVLGMLLFITSEVMFFAGLFAAYFNVRAAAPQWPPVNPETGEAFHLAILPLVGPATVILILSSFTCQMAVWAIRRDDRVGFIRAIAVTFTIGVVFLLMQAADYILLAEEGITLSAGTFGTTYFTLTGFHGAHVFGGAIMLGVVLYRGMAGQFSARHHDAVEAASLYWHFVDVVWILLFSLLYLLPGK